MSQTWPASSADARWGADRLTGARVAVWGTGAEGRTAAALAAERGATVTVFDDTRPTRSEVRSPADLADAHFDVVLRSPGVSRYRPELLAAAAGGAVVTTLTALWLHDFADAPVVAVTGSKGKTTTALLTAAVLRAGGLRVAVGGNMGRPLADLYRSAGAPRDRSGAQKAASDQVPGGDQDSGVAPDAYVVEVSSFQAAEVTASPRVGVFTLLAPDHLDWHGSYERYVEDKLNLFAHRPGMLVAVNAIDGPAWEAAARFPGRIGYGAPRSQVELAVEASVDGAVTVPSGVLVDGAPYLAAADLASARFALRGSHNLVNLCGALTAARALTGQLADPEAVRRELDRQEPLASRLHTVATAGGVEFVDDALASNPAGTVAALRAFAGRRICLLAGGADRGVSLTPLVVELQMMDPPPVVVVLDDAGRRLAGELGQSVRWVAAGSVAEAVGRAVDLLSGEGVVLLSPAAPTPPAIGSYRQRSAAFSDAASAAAARLGVATGPTC